MLVPNPHVSFVVICRTQSYLLSSHYIQYIKYDDIVRHKYKEAFFFLLRSLQSQGKQRETVPNITEG